jgi:tRNA1Val (adenine37-N6)-methyltransferase
MGSIFRFKQFEVDQSGCAMKINTDGVLLGAIATQPDPKYILDIGTGTGVIALMLAQRFPEAQVDAVEIDALAAASASRNGINSPFAARVQVVHQAIEEYESLQLYDLIVSNPPYFVNDLKNPELRKGIARHTDAQFFEQLMARVDKLLKPLGAFWFILPVKQAESTIEIAANYGLKPAFIIHLHSDESKPEFRQMVRLDRSGADLLEEHLYIYKAQGEYTANYKELLKDFFLAF